MSAGEVHTNDCNAIIPIRHYGGLDTFSNRVGLALAVYAKPKVRRSTERPPLLANLERPRINWRPLSFQTERAMSPIGSAPRRRGSLVEEDSTQRVVD